MVTEVCSCACYLLRIYVIFLIYFLYPKDIMMLIRDCLQWKQYIYLQIYAMFISVDASKPGIEI